MTAKSRSTQLEVAADTSMERLVASQLSRVLVLVPPWLLVVLVVIVTAVFHAAWGMNTLAALGIGAAGLALAVLVFVVTHQRGRLGRWHATGTAAAVAVWVASATIDGVTNPVPRYLAVVGGLTLAISWNIRSVIRSRHGRDDADGLASVFADAADTAGLGKSRLQVRSRGERKVEAVLMLPAGERTADDVVKRTAHLESGLRFPPGSLSIAPDLDRADRVLVRISDPRIMRRPAPWPGPSRSGASVALPLEPGIWQDGETVRYVITGHHLQVMGMTGSGKSIGAAWSLLAELVTRSDCAVVAIDCTKGDQSFGALRPALHRFETTKDGARSLLTAVHAVIRPRTDYLAGRGLQRWQENCGLTYLVVWLEEAPDVLDALGDKGLERWLSALKAARSAGITFVVSLQRADWSQMPTLARGQLAKLTMGVENAADAGFGLSEIQQERNCRPELWNNSQPGMAYLSAPGVDDDRIAMPIRVWFWGSDDKLMREHAARWPADKRPLDALTAAAINAPETHADPVADDGQADDASLVDQIAPVEEPADAEEPPAQIEVPGDDFGRWQFGQPPAVKADPAVARQRLNVLIESWRTEGRKAFAIGDLAGFRSSVGLSRPWLYKCLGELADAGLIERDDDSAGRWLIRT